MNDRAQDWISGGDTGISSVAIWRHMMGLPPARRWAWGNAPVDPDDFRRCYRLLQRIPEWRPRIAEMAVYPGWRGLALAWEELEGLYERECPKHHGRAPLLYARMRELIDADRNRTAASTSRARAANTCVSRAITMPDDPLIQRLGEAIREYTGARVNWASNLTTREQALAAYVETDAQLNAALDDVARELASRPTEEECLAALTERARTALIDLGPARRAIELVHHAKRRAAEEGR